jgi:hypothetical protein
MDLVRNRFKSIQNIVQTGTLEGEQFNMETADYSIP